MITKAVLDCEKKSLKRLERFQLPSSFKRIGIVLFIFFFLGLFLNAFSVNLLEIRAFTKYGLLVSLLFISLSRERIEDELIIRLRMQSYTFAFIWGVAFALFQPFINYGVDYVLKPADAILKDSGDFQILWLLLCVQVCYFELLKRMHR